MLLHFTEQSIIIVCIWPNLELILEYFVGGSQSSLDCLAVVRASPEAVNLIILGETELSSFGILDKEEPVQKLV